MWASEVISHVVVLSSPVAACYAARVLSRISAQHHQEDRSCSTSRQRSSPDRVLGLALAPEPKQFPRQGDEVLQYSNATFCYESSVDCGTDSADCEEDDLQFYMLTPQEAQGALGEHATQFKKIYLNGLTFVEQADEERTVLSLDEYATRMQSVVGRLRPSESFCGSSAPCSPCLSPVAHLERHELHELESAARCVPDSCASSLASGSSCRSSASCSGSSSLSFLHSGLGALGTPRTSFEAPNLRSSASASSCSAFSPCDFQKGSTEGVQAASEHARPVMVPCPSQSQSPSHASAEQRLLDAALGTWPEAEESELVPDSPQPRNTVELVTSSSAPPCAAHTSCTVRPAWRPCGGAASKVTACSPSAEHRTRTTTTKKPADTLGRRRSATTASSAPTPSSPRTPVCDLAAASKHRSPSTGGSCAGPLPLPPAAAVARFASQAEQQQQQQQPRMLRTLSAEEELPSSLARRSAPPSAAGAPSLYPRPSLGGVHVGPACVAPVGLSKAPALPLPVPDGSGSAAEVPPALRYYLAQARAASVGGAEASCCESSADGTVAAAEAGAAGQRKGAPAEDCVVRRPGFVKATVEQLNTQRLVCCHVTPFAVAKTSRTPRALTPQPSPQK